MSIDCFVNDTLNIAVSSSVYKKRLFVTVIKLGKLGGESRKEEETRIQQNTLSLYRVADY